MIYPNLINSITKLQFLSIIKGIAKKKAAPLAQLCVSSGWSLPLFYLTRTSIVIKKAPKKHRQITYGNKGRKLFLEIRITFSVKCVSMQFYTLLCSGNNYPIYC